jgi:hypothetical protein
MVAPKPGEPLLLYIAATVDAVSMVLVVERPEPCQHQEPEAEEAPGSLPQEAPQEPKAEEAPAPKLCDRANTIAEPQLPEVDLGPINQEATESQLLGAHSNSRG